MRAGAFGEGDVFEANLKIKDFFRYGGGRRGGVGEETNSSTFSGYKVLENYKSIVFWGKSKMVVTPQFVFSSSFVVT